MMDAEIVAMRSALDTMVHEIWEDVVKNTNRVLYHAEFYGFGLMDIPDPDVQQVAKALSAAIPAFERVLAHPELSPDNGLKLERARHAVLCLQNMALALQENSEVKFESAVEALRQQAMF